MKNVEKFLQEKRYSNGKIILTWSELSEVEEDDVVINVEDCGISGNSPLLHYWAVTTKNENEYDVCTLSRDDMNDILEEIYEKLEKEYNKLYSACEENEKSVEIKLDKKEYLFDFKMIINYLDDRVDYSIEENVIRLGLNTEHLKEINNVDYESMKDFIFHNVDNHYNLDILLKNFINELGEAGGEYGIFENVSNERFEITINNILLDEENEEWLTTYDIITLE